MAPHFFLWLCYSLEPKAKAKAKASYLAHLKNCQFEITMVEA